MFFRRQSLRNMWPIQLVSLLFTVRGIFFSPLTLCITSFLTRSFRLIFSVPLHTTFRNIPGISDPLSNVSKFHHHTKLCSKCSTLLVPSLHLSLICWLKKPSCLMPFSIAIPDLISRVHLAKIVIMFEIFHILQLFLICHNLYWGRLPWNSHYLGTFHIHFLSTASSNFN